MKHAIKYLASSLAAAAVGAGTIGLAPASIADTGTASVAHPKTSTHLTTPQAPDWPQYETGVDPVLPSDTGADPYALLPYGDDRPF